MNGDQPSPSNMREGILIKTIVAQHIFYI
jgi:hypothetical protein